MDHASRDICLLNCIECCPSYTKEEDVSSHNVEDDIRKFAKLGLDSHGDENTLTASKTVEDPDPASVIPGDLYVFIQEALALRKHLKTNKDDKDAISNLRCVEGQIRIVARFRKLVGHLPSDWKFNPDTAGNLVAWKCPPPKKHRPITKKEKAKKGPRVYPNIYRVMLDTEDQKTWEKFRELDESVPALTGIEYPNDEEQKTSVADDHIIVRFIGEFAVDAFNKSCQMYVNKNIDKNITEAKFRACKYHKMTTEYHFYMTIVAVEQENLGVYETKVDCNAVDGARTLAKFELTNRKPSGKSNRAKPFYETFKDGSPDLEDYEISGMVRRKTKGGYDYHNPSGVERVWQW